MKNTLTLAAGFVFVFAMLGRAEADLNVIGLEGELEHNSEFLFGFSGTSNAQLVLTFSSGGPVTLSTNGEQGWWSSNFANTDGNTNYFVGDLSNNGSQLLNNFFTFNVVGQSPTVTSATLRVVRETGESDLGAVAHTYSTFDVSTDATTLNLTNGTNAAIFNDLGSGNSYGSFVITVAGSTSEVLLLNLNGNAVADINAAIAGGSRFSLGGTLTPSAAAVPEPSTFALIAIGGLGMAWSALRRRRHSL